MRRLHLQLGMHSISYVCTRIQQRLSREACSESHRWKLGCARQERRWLPYPAFATSDETCAVLYNCLIRSACLGSALRSGQRVLECRAGVCALTSGNYFDARMLAANASVVARGECFDLRSRLQEARHLRQSLTLEHLQAGGCRGAAAWRVQPGSGRHAGNALQIE